MKYVSVLLALVLAFVGLCACAGPRDPAADPTADPAADPVADTAREKLADFTAQMANGDTFTLSEALKQGKPVLINLWATWCPYCIREFPYMQAVYEKNRETLTMAVLTVEPEDTPEVIRAFAAENGYTFPMGSAVGTGLERYGEGGIPVTLVVDKNGYIAENRIGMAQSEEELFGLVKGLLPETVCVYKVYCVDVAAKTMLPGCTVTFCTEEKCVPVSLPEGCSENCDLPPANYTVKLVSAPEGYVLEPGRPEEIEVGPEGGSIEFYLVQE